VLELVAVLEAGIDFAEDDVSVLPNDEVRKADNGGAAAAEAISRIVCLRKLVHEGLTLAIVGRPMWGSQFVQRLVERERAIVTPVRARLATCNRDRGVRCIPVELVDTAGIRRAVDEAESIGIRKSLEAVADADVVSW